MPISEPVDSQVPEPRFPWIPFYEELARRAVAEPEELLLLVRKLGAEGLPVPAFEDRLADRSKRPLETIDPFTFFATFNRQITPDKRTAVLEGLRRHYGIQTARVGELICISGSAAVQALKGDGSDK
jgi:hypothetical protein